MRGISAGTSRWATEPFRAMGSACSIDTLGLGASTLNRQGRDQVARLEALWSRFVPSSDVCRVNASPGTPVKVSTETIELALFALDAWTQSSGAFCPFLGALMNEHGYDETFEAVRARSYQSVRSTRTLQLVLSSTNQRVASLVPTMSPISLDEAKGTLCIEPGYELDFGGVAKGYAADLIADTLMASGAKAVLVSLGGDVSCRTAEDEDTIWTIESEGPRHPNSKNRIQTEGGPFQAAEVGKIHHHRDVDLEVGSIASLDLRNGGVATSSTYKRAWVKANGTRVHHLMNPQTQSSVSSGVILCSIAADSCAHAEVLTKIVLCGGASVCADIVNRFVPDVLAVLENGVILDYGSWIRT
jgi:FAD:protein FMN transferase